MKALRSASLGFALLLPAFHAGAVDLTGTYTGKFICTYNYGTKGTSTEKNQTLRITQTGSALNADWGSKMTGYVINDSKKPNSKGQFTLIDCETSSATATTAYSEIANLSANIDAAKQKGSINGLSIYFNPIANNGNVNEVGQCKWIFKMVSASNPGITACP